MSHGNSVQSEENGAADSGDPVERNPHIRWEVSEDTAGGHMRDARDGSLRITTHMNGSNGAALPNEHPLQRASLDVPNGGTYGVSPITMAAVSRQLTDYDAVVDNGEPNLYVKSGGFGNNYISCRNIPYSGGSRDNGGRRDPFDAGATNNNFSGVPGQILHGMSSTPYTGSSSSTAGSFEESPLSPPPRAQAFGVGGPSFPSQGLAYPSTDPSYSSADPDSESQSCDDSVSGTSSTRLPWAGIEPLLLSGAVSADPVQRGIIYAILVGDFSIMSEWSLATQVVRVFLSSTFSDTSQERDVLLKEALPRIRAYARGKGLEFEFLDLRWGITAQMQANHETTDICLACIRQCQMESPYLNFVSLLGQKYGWRGSPNSLSVEQYESLLRLMASKVDADLFTKWFKLDENSVPPRFILLPIMTHFPLLETHPDDVEESESDDAWIESQQSAGAEMESLGECIRTAVSNADLVELEDEDIDLRSFTKSITDLETTFAFCYDKSAPDRGNRVWLRRTFRDLDACVANKTANVNKFIDCDADGVHADSQLLLADMKTRMCAGIAAENIHTYDALDFAPGIGIDPTNAAHRAYLDRFVADFEAEMQRGIDRHAQIISDAQKTPLVYDIANHMQYAKMKGTDCVGRVSLINSILRYVDAPSADHPLIVYGPSGSGKTCLVAKACTEAFTRLTARADGVHPVFLVRFLNQSFSGMSLELLLRGLCVQMRVAYSIQSSEIEDSEGNDEATFQKCLTFATAERPLYIFLDELDVQFAEAHELRWIPWSSMPAHVHINVESNSVFAAVCETVGLTAENSLLVDQLDEADMKSIFRSLLVTKGHRRLRPTQRQYLMDTFRKFPSALYLKLSLKRARTWRSFTPDDKIILPDGLRAMIKSIFVDLQHKYGMCLVQRALGYITAARVGLAPREIEDILSCDEDVLNETYDWWIPSVRRIPPLMWMRFRNDLGSLLISKNHGGVGVLTWNHQECRDVAMEFFVQTREIKEQIHEVLADFFKGRWAGDAEKPFYYSRRTLQRQEEVLRQRYGDEWTGTSSTYEKRMVADQPLYFNQGGELVPNLRKIYELPYHLANAKLHHREELGALCYGLYSYLLAYVEAMPVSSLVHDIEYAYSPAAGLRGGDVSRTDGMVLADAIRLSSHAIRIDPLSLGAQLMGRIRDTTGVGLLADLLGSVRAYMNTRTTPRMVPLHCCLQEAGGALARNIVVEQKKGLLSVSATGDGAVIATASEHGVHLWTASTGTEIQRFVDKGIVLAEISSDGSMYATITRRSEVNVCDAKTGERACQLISDEVPVQVAFSHDTRFAATGGMGGNIRVWDSASGGVLGELFGHKRRISSLAFSLDGKHLTSSSLDRTAIYWDLDCLQVQWRFTAHTRTVSSARLTPCQAFVVTASHDKTACLWDVGTGTEIHRYEPHRAEVLDFVITDDILITCAADNFIYVWELHTGGFLQSFLAHASTINGIALTRGGRELATVCSKDRTMKFWRVFAIRQYSEQGSATKKPISGLTRAGDADTKTYLAGVADNEVCFLDVYGTMQGQPLRHDGRIVCCAVLQGMKLIVTGSHDGSLHIWGMDGKVVKVIRKAHDHDAPITGLIVLPDESCLISACAEGPGALRIWNTTTWLSMGTNQEDLNGVRNMVFVPSVKNICTTSEDGGIKLWTCDLDLRRTIIPIARKRRGQRWPTAMALALGGPDNSMLYIGHSDGMVQSYRINRNTEEGLRYHGHSQEVTCLALSTDNTLLVTASTDHNILLWDTAEGLPLSLFSLDEHAVCCLTTFDAAADGEENCLTLGTLDGRIVHVILCGKTHGYSTANVIALKQKTAKRAERKSSGRPDGLRGQHDIRSPASSTGNSNTTSDSSGRGEHADAPPLPRPIRRFNTYEDADGFLVDGTRSADRTKRGEDRTPVHHLAQMANHQQLVKLQQWQQQSQSTHAVGNGGSIQYVSTRAPEAPAMPIHASGHGRNAGERPPGVPPRTLKPNPPIPPRTYGATTKPKLNLPYRDDVLELDSENQMDARRGGRKKKKVRASRKKQKKTDGPYEDEQVGEESRLLDDGNWRHGSARDRDIGDDDSDRPRKGGGLFSCCM